MHIVMGIKFSPLDLDRAIFVCKRRYRGMDQGSRYYLVNRVDSHLCRYPRIVKDQTSAHRSRLR